MGFHSHVAARRNDHLTGAVEHVIFRYDQVRSFGGRKRDQGGDH